MSKSTGSSKSSKTSSKDGLHGVRRQIAGRGEQAVEKVAEDFLSSKLVGGAVQAMFDARQKAGKVQGAAMEALNLPSASDLQTLTRRVRSVSQRLESVEDGIDRLEDRLGGLLERTSVAKAGGNASSEGLADTSEQSAEDRLASLIDGRLQGLDEKIQRLTDDLGAIAARVPEAPETVSIAQERLSVGSGGE